MAHPSWDGWYSWALFAEFAENSWSVGPAIHLFFCAPDPQGVALGWENGGPFGAK